MPTEIAIPLLTAYPDESRHLNQISAPHFLRHILVVGSAFSLAGIVFLVLAAPFDFEASRLVYFILGCLFSAVGVILLLCSTCMWGANQDAKRITERVKGGEYSEIWSFTHEEWSNYLQVEFGPTGEAMKVVYWNVPRRVIGAAFIGVFLGLRVMLRRQASPHTHNWFLDASFGELWLWGFELGLVIAAALFLIETLLVFLRSVRASRHIGGVVVSKWGFFFEQFFLVNTKLRCITTNYAGYTVKSYPNGARLLHFHRMVGSNRTVKFRMPVPSSVQSTQVVSRLVGQKVTAQD